MRRGDRLGLAAALVLLGGLSGFLAAHLVRGQRPTARVPPVSESLRPSVLTPGDSASQPQANSENPRREIPERLPAVTLADEQGRLHSLTEWAGHPLLINFWATWCEPCRREMPLLKMLRRERESDGLEVIGIAVDFRDAVSRFRREMNIDYPVLIGEQDALDAITAFGMDAVFPFTVFTDSRGRIVTLKVGELHPDEAALILDRMREAERGGMDLPQAQRDIASGVAELAQRRNVSEAGLATAAPATR